MLPSSALFTVDPLPLHENILIILDIAEKTNLKRSLFLSDRHPYTNNDREKFFRRLMNINVFSLLSLKHLMYLTFLAVIVSVSDEW